MFFLNYSNVIDPLLKEVRSFVAELAKVKEGDRFLDMCCGTGDQLFYFLNSRIESFGVDMNPGMIKIAEGRKKRTGAKNITFLPGDVTKLPFEESSFDFALISLGLHEMEEKLRDEAISEMRRVVKNKGFLMFAAFSSPLPNNFSSFIVKRVEYFVDKKRFKNYIKKGGLLGVLKKNNIKIEKVHFLMSGLISAIKTENIHLKP